MQPDKNAVNGIAVLVISVIAMVMLAYFGIKYFRNQANLRQGQVLGVGSSVEPLPPTSTPTPTSAQDPLETTPEMTPQFAGVPSDWVKYENLNDGYSLYHPEDVTVSPGADGYLWIYQFNEPAQPGVGDYDGIAIRIRSQALNGKNLEQVAMEDAAAQQVAEITQNVGHIEINGTSGFGYTARALGTYKKIFLPVAKTGNYLEIISSADNSDQKNYKEISEQIISTIQVRG